MTPRHAVPAVPPLRDADQGIRPVVAYLGLLVAVPSFWALAFFQHKLLQTAFPFAPGELTGALAVGIDSFGVLAGAYWLCAPRKSDLRRWGFLFAVLAVIGSTALTMWSIYRLAPGYELLGLLPALIVFGTTKMFTVWQAARHADRDVLADAAAAVDDAQARDLERERAAAAGRTALLAALAARDAEHRDQVAALEGQLAAVRAELADRPARLRSVPPSREVRDQEIADTRPLPAVGAVAPDLEVVAAWIRERRANVTDGVPTPLPDGQRFAADAFGVSRAVIRDVHVAAKDLVDAEQASAVGT